MKQPLLRRIYQAEQTSAGSDPTVTVQVSRLKVADRIAKVRGFISGVSFMYWVGLSLSIYGDQSYEGPVADRLMAIAAGGVAVYLAARLVMAVSDRVLTREWRRRAAPPTGPR